MVQVRSCYLISLPISNGTQPIVDHMNITYKIQNIACDFHLFLQVSTRLTAKLPLVYLVCFAAIGGVSMTENTTSKNLYHTFRPKSVLTQSNPATQPTTTSPRSPHFTREPGQSTTPLEGPQTTPCLCSPLTRKSLNHSARKTDSKTAREVTKFIRDCETKPPISPDYDTQTSCGSWNLSTRERAPSALSLNEWRPVSEPRSRLMRHVTRGLHVTIYLRSCHLL